MSRTLLLSDLHIGFRFSRASDILRVLNLEKFDRLILVGDIFDIEQLMKRPYWDEHHTAVLKNCLLYTSPSPRDGLLSRMPSSA